MTGAELPEGPPRSFASRVTQFYSRQIRAAAGSAILLVALYLLVGTKLSNLSQEAFGTLAGMFATLLGLTFAAFAVLTGLMPSIPRNLMRSKTVLMFGQTFVFTMWVQLATLLAAGLCYIGYGSGWVAWVGELVIAGAVLSVAFLLVVVHYMLFLFKLVRKHVAGDDAPTSVL